ncbi:MAG: DegT/DnrJ/EryC1/StrS family aminotransferase [Candidatus Peribacteraceae bacterium]|jgi:perosamine synthetase
MKVPVNMPVISPEAKAAVLEALESGWISSAGPAVTRFEQEFARCVGMQHGIAVMNGTAALHLALASLGIGRGDEVIVPDFTMIATVTAVLYTGAQPVFVDVERETFAMDPALLEAAITPRTKAILPVHLFGHSADMDPILAIAKAHGLAVIEDAAEVHGATYRGKKCGSMGIANCFSFYANKIITTGEGGMVVTDDAAIAEHARRLRDLAHSPGRRFWHTELGFNYRMTNLQAAVGLGELSHLDDYVEKKQWMAKRYAEEVSGIPGLRLPVTKSYATNVYWMYAVLVEDELGMTRDALRARLLERGVDTRDFFYPCHSQPFLKDHPQATGSFPVSEDVAQRGFYLPSGLALTEEQLLYTCEALRSVIRGR